MAMPMSLDGMQLLICGVKEYLAVEDSKSYTVWLRCWGHVAKWKVTVLTFYPSLVLLPAHL